MTLSVRQVFLFNVQAAIDRCIRHPEYDEGLDSLLWTVNHRFAPHQGDLALRNGLRYEQLPEDCRRDLGEYPRRPLAAMGEV